MNQDIVLKQREEVVISGVEHVYSFDENRVELKTTLGDLTIEGQELDMNKLSLDDYLVCVKGTIDSLIYKKSRKPEESFWKKVFK